MRIALIVLIVAFLGLVADSQLVSPDQPAVSSDPPPSITVPPTSSDPPTTSAPPTSSNPPPSSSVAPTSSNPPPSSSVQPTSSVVPSSSVPPSSSSVPPSSSSVPPSSSQPPSSSITPSSSSSSSSESHSSASSSSPTASHSATPSHSGDDGNSHTATIAGAVVGGVVGIALIGGLLTWINRRGGCTSRSKTKQRPNDFEDFGLAETDFPHHRSPPMANANLAPGAAAAGGAAAVAGVGAGGASPTLPRLNDQGNFYHDPSTAEYGTNRHYVPSYQPQLSQADYSPQPQHQPYYYDNAQPQQGYYDEHGYYYDNSTAVSSSQGYPSQQGGYEGGEQYYKPDTADGKPHLRS